MRDWIVERSRVSMVWSEVEVEVEAVEAEVIVLATCWKKVILSTILRIYSHYSVSFLIKDAQFLENLSLLEERRACMYKQ